MNLFVYNNNQKPNFSALIIQSLNMKQSYSCSTGLSCSKAVECYSRDKPLPPLDDSVHFAGTYPLRFNQWLAQCNL